MPVHAASDALRAEIRAPTVATAAQTENAVRAVRVELADLGRQVSTYQQLLADAEADETNPSVRQKIAGFASRVRGLHREHHKLETALASLRQSLDGVATEAVALADVIDQET